MSHQQPFVGQVTKGSPSLRKKRTVFALALGLITFLVFLHFSESIFSLARSPSQRGELDDLYGLLYMVSNTENLLTHEPDASAPIPPSTWVPQEAFNQQVWNQRIEQLNEDTPVIVFSKSYCPYSKRAKQLLASYALTPAPYIVEVDLRDDRDFIKRLLHRLTDLSTFPNVILRGKSLGGYDSLNELHKAGDLAQELKRAGVEFTGIMMNE